MPVRPFRSFPSRLTSSLLSFARRRRVIFSLLTVSALAASYVLVTLVPYLRANTGDTMQTKVAAWARDHRLGAVVDWAEQVKYSDAPSGGPASDLDVLGGSSVSTVPPSSTPTTTLPPYRPADLTPQFDTPLKGEGVWRAAREVNGVTAVWTTGIRPLRDSGSVTASFAIIDQSVTQAALFNGPETPGGSGWRRGRRIDTDLLPFTIAAFNGGFRKEHTKGGYFNEGREVWPLVDGAASLVIRADGTVDIGKWGRDYASTDGLRAVRQNLLLFVDGGKAMAKERDWSWGAWKDGNLYIMRSAACVRTDGKLMFAMAGDISAAQFSNVLAQASCDRAIQLDVNYAWPKFYTFEAGVPTKLDRRVSARTDLYISGALKDFVAFFERDVPTELAEKLR